MNRIKTAFDCITASESIKNDTLLYIHNQRDKQANRVRICRKRFRYVTACAVFLIFFAGFGAYSIYTSPVSYISIDVNPSFELALNRFDLVITASAYNDEGSEVLDSVKLTGKNYTDAVDTLLSSSEMSQYLDNDSELSFTVISEDESELIDGIQKCHAYNQYGGHCNGADMELRDAAAQSGLSFGKYRAYLELSQYNPDITPEDCHGMTMREINDMINMYTDENSTHGSHNNSNKGSGSNTGRHMHKGAQKGNKNE